MRARGVTFTLAMMLTTAAASAQQWSVEGHAGRIRSTLDPAAASSESFALGLRYDDRLTGFRASAGIPASGEAPLWGALALGRRLAVQTSGFIAGVDVTANGFLLHDRVERTREVRDFLGRPSLEPIANLSGHAIAGQLMPVIGFESARMQAQLRAGISEYSSKFGDQRRDRSVQLADAQVTITPTPFVAITPAARLLRADEGDFKYAGVTGVIANQHGSLWASGGQWLELENNATAWAVGGSLKLHERATLNASARHDAIDPLYLSPPQTAWSVGLAIKLNRLPTASAPLPASYRDGRATIRLAARNTAGPVRIAGDFNSWKPQPMQRVGDEWTFTVALAPGVYNYAFVDPGGAWFVPEKQPGRKADGMGGYVATVVVQ